MLAPSSHNTQPWRFRIAARYIDIVADRTRSLRVTDPQGRELTISCGCALLNLRIAALHLGLVSESHLFPDGVDSDTIARVEFSPNPVVDADPALFGAIPTRRTYRKPFLHQPVEDALVRGLVAEAVREGAWLDIVSDDAMRHSVADLVEEGDRIQWSRREWRKELATWMRPPEAGDGLATSRLSAPLVRMVIRTLNLGRALGRRDRRLVEQSPLLAVLGTYGDSAGDWLVAGQALQRLLLWARSRGLQASFLNQPIQVAALREKLTTMLGIAGFPQIVLRIGHPAEETPPSPRRRLGEVARTVP